MTSLEAEALARLVVARHSDAPENWLLWEDYPELSQSEFERLTIAVESEVNEMFRAVDRCDWGSGIDSRYLLERAQ